MTNSTAYDLAARICKMISDDMLPAERRGGSGVTIGYIGNMEQWGDDRSWRIFLPHPNRVGTYRDSRGGHKTEDNGRLLEDVLKLFDELRAA